MSLPMACWTQVGPWDNKLARGEAKAPGVWMGDLRFFRTAPPPPEEKPKQTFFNFWPGGGGELEEDRVCLKFEAFHLKALG